eukprot:364743-Chlamydomonas_euryale.AAC.89
MSICCRTVLPSSRASSLVCNPALALRSCRLKSGVTTALHCAASTGADSKQQENFDTTQFAA